MEEKKEFTKEEWEIIKQQYLKEHTPWKRVGKQYRNDVCSCGSGRKVKQCCGVNSRYKL
jgi:uncharacterized protein YecA (UPF0149 family)